MQVCKQPMEHVEISLTVLVTLEPQLLHAPVNTAWISVGTPKVQLFPENCQELMWEQGHYGGLCTSGEKQELP